MADKEKQKEIFESAESFKDYFSDDELALDELLKKLQNLQDIANNQIQTMVEAAPGRGVQHNLIEHMTNAISIASQFQSVLKDKRSIKERSLDLAIKSTHDEGESTDMEDVILNMQKLIKETRETRTDQVSKLTSKIDEQNKKSDLELDKEIEKKLGLN